MIDVVLSLVDNIEHRVTIGNMVFFTFKDKGDALIFEREMVHLIKKVEGIGASFDLDGSKN